MAGGGASAISRRDLLAGRMQPERRDAILPPGATEAGLKACTACGACAEVCPSGIIAMANGIPRIDFMRGECTFCGACADACPEPVFADPPPQRFSHKITISDDCLAENGITCMTCRDVCPELAISFSPRMGAPFEPVLHDDKCTGCGACIGACPAGAISVTHAAQELHHA